MSSIEHPGSRLDRSTTALMKTGSANGLAYYSFGITDPLAGRDSEVPCDSTTFVRCFSYYPRGVLSGEGMLGRIEGGTPFSSAAGRALTDIFEEDYDAQLRNGIALTEHVEPVVTFTRRASSEGISLAELRVLTLRKHAAPMAAVAIYSADDCYAMQVMTPAFMWPWQALRMMQEGLKSDSNEQ